MQQCPSREQRLFSEVHLAVHKIYVPLMERLNTVFLSRYLTVIRADIIVHQ